MMMRGCVRFGLWGLLGGLALFASGCRCAGDSGPQSQGDREEVTVLRVESSSPEAPGAEHCDEKGAHCSPLAPQQKLKPKGIVRTFAGGKVSLDFGGGRRVDLASMSETVLSPKQLKLEKGEFSLESTPLVEKEPFVPLTFTAGDRTIKTAQDRATSTTVSVRKDETLLSIRRGLLNGITEPGKDDDTAGTGQNLRLANASVYRTGAGGQELPNLRYVAPRVDEFGGLLSERGPRPSRGLGTMTARLPNTDQIRDGVVLKTHEVRVVIQDGFARTEVEEVFENTSPHVLEGRYRFPVPGDASLSRLALWVGDELVEGEVLERKRAADIYKRIVDRPIPRDPALLEWVTGGEMSLKVFPIIPQKTRRVLLAYNQALSTENGVLRYVYPLSLGAGRETLIEELSITVHLTDSGSLRNLRAPGYDARFGNEGPFKTVSLTLKGTSPTRDFVVEAERDITPVAQLASFLPESGTRGAKIYRNDFVPRLSASQSKGHFALRISADLPEETRRPQLGPQNRAIVIDVSQSQSSETILAEAALAYGILREMNPDERFVLLACDSACESFPSEGPIPATNASRQRALSFLTGLKQGGSSDIAGGLIAAATQLKRTAKDGHEAQIIAISDGQASSGDLTAETIARRARPHLREVSADLRVIGAGRTVDEDNLLGIARECDATFDRLETASSLEDRIFEIAGSLRRPVIRKPVLTLPPSLRAEGAQQLPALRLGQEVILTGEITDHPAGSVTLNGQLSNAPYELVRSISWESSKQAQNPLIPRLWARERIAALSAKELTPTVKDEIIRVSTEYRTMSRLTSFLVLENEKMYADFGVQRTSQSAEDQPDAAFSQLVPPPSTDAPSESFKDQSLTSFEELESAVDSKDSIGRAAATPPRVQVSTSAARPRPRPAPSPKPAKSSSSLADLGDFGGGTAGLGSAEASGSGAAGEESAPSFAPWDDRPKRRPLFRPPPRRRTAHLRFAQADDEWRKWGEKNLGALSESLREDENSRARHEAYILGHLKHGRFKEARLDAERFIELDPDYDKARELLAYAAVVDGDHELSRRMLDVRSESAPYDAAAHTESARSFDVAGDLVRACAHYRALAEIAPNLTDAVQRASSCWEEVLGHAPPSSRDEDEGKPGQLQIDVRCDDGTKEQDCPAPVVVGPDGRVLSPWTPGVGRSRRSRVTFVKLRTGDYFILVLGGAPQAKGTVTLTGRQESQAFKFQGGGMHTIAKASVSFW